MNSIYKTMCTITLIPVLSACASKPDPAEVCTHEWIQPRVETTMTKFAKRTGDAIKTLKTASKSIKVGISPTPAQMVPIVGALATVSSAFKTGPTSKDLRTIERTCNIDNLTKIAINDYFKTQGLSHSLLDIIKNTDEYKTLIHN